MLHEDKYNCTGMQLSAVMCHGWGVEVFLAFEHIGCGSSYTWECLLHSINTCWKAATTQGRMLPRSCPS